MLGSRWQLGRRRVLIVIQKGEMRFRESETKPVGVNPGASPERGRLAPASPFRNINLASVRRRRLLGRATSVPASSRRTEVASPRDAWRTSLGVQSRTLSDSGTRR